MDAKQWEEVGWDSDDTDLFSRDDKKLTTKKFKQILLEIQDKTMIEQEKHLDLFAENWQAGIEQIDDILVIGVRL